MEKFTWNDLAKAINELPAEQREKQACISIEDESVYRKVTGLETVPEDIYVNKEDREDCGPIKELEQLHGEYFVREDYILGTPKGMPFLVDDF